MTIRVRLSRVEGRNDGVLAETQVAGHPAMTREEFRLGPASPRQAMLEILSQIDPDRLLSVEIGDYDSRGEAYRACGVCYHE